MDNDSSVNKIEMSNSHKKNQEAWFWGQMEAKGEPNFSEVKVKGPRHNSI